MPDRLCWARSSVDRQGVWVPAIWHEDGRIEQLQPMGHVAEQGVILGDALPRPKNTPAIDAESLVIERPFAEGSGTDA